MSKPNYLNPKNQTAGRLGFLKDLGQKLSAFVDDFAGRPIHEITTPELDRWIHSLKVSGTTAIVTNGIFPSNQVW
jgi:hypothetical protein